jgi:hypothetical protein
MAEVTLRLLSNPERWIHRRVERIQFKDDERVHHQVSVDFTLPTDVSPIGEFEGKKIYIAPLFLLVKDDPEPLREGRRPLRKFLLVGSRRADTEKTPIPTAPYSNLNFTNQDGRRLALVRRRQSSQLAAMVLLVAAERAAGKKALTPELEEQISEIPNRSWAELNDKSNDRIDKSKKSVLEWLLEDRVYPWDPRRKLREDDGFRELVYVFASHSIVSSLILEGAPRRSIHKLSYDESPSKSLSAGRGRFLRSFGWKSEQYSVPITEIGAAASYHVEIEVPEEIELNETNLVGKRYRWYGLLVDENDQDYTIRQVRTVNEGSIYLPEPLRGRRLGLVWVKLRASREGFLSSVLATSVITTALLGLAAYGAPHVLPDRQSESATAALLLVPAIVAALIVRPGEHAITAKMLRGVRIVLVVNALVPALAVFFLITEPERGKPNAGSLASWLLNRFHSIFGGPKTVEQGGMELRVYWIALATISAVLTVLLAVSYILPLPHGPSVYRLSSGDQTET